MNLKDIIKEPIDSLGFYDDHAMQEQTEQLRMAVEAISKAENKLQMAQDAERTMQAISYIMSAQNDLRQTLESITGVPWETLKEQDK